MGALSKLAVKAAKTALKDAPYFPPGSPERAANLARFTAGSKVILPGGGPLTLFHGTSTPTDFSAFKRRPGDIGMHFGTLGQAEDRWSYLRGRRDAPESTSPRVLPVYLRITSPLRMEDAGSWNPDNLDYAFKDAFPRYENTIRQLRTTKDYREFLQNRGYDGVVYKNTGEVAGGSVFQEAQDAAREVLIASQKARGRPLNAYDFADRQTPEYQKYDAAYNAALSHRMNAAEDSYIAFDPRQIKSIFNRGTYDRLDPDMLKARGGRVSSFAVKR